jgi:hypothetical protein
MVSSTVTISCLSKECHKQLRVPSDRGKLTITCPNCRTSWDWTPKNSLPETSILQFRCANTGKHFHVLFARQDTSMQFRITNVSSELAEFKDDCMAVRTRSTDGSENNSSQPSNLSVFNAIEFDFSGWYCPCCNHSKHKNSLEDFICCGTCGEYVCGGRIIQISNGSQTFKCHDGCNGRGIVEGFIKSFSGDSNQLQSSQIVVIDHSN